MHELDDLTGLPVRGAFLGALREALRDAARSGSPLCLLVLDLDFLKTINDQYGHPAGDGALRAVAAALRDGLRARDLAGRYGGDEFVALLAGTPLPAGLAIAERVRAAVAARPLAAGAGGPHLHLGLSVGVAAFPEDGADAGALFAAADRGVYAAKAAGRNRVRACVPDAPSPRLPDEAIAPHGRLVGRQEELARLRARLERACRGEGGLAMIEGEAGIGKTRLAEEVAGLAGLLGARAAVARCHQVELASPYQPFLDLLRTLMEAATTEALRAAAGPWAGEVARLAPGLRERLPEASPLPPLPPEEDRSRLQEALCRVLLGLATAPTLLILDDAQWADEASVRVLSRLAWGLAGSPLLLLCTVRAEDLPPAAPLATALSALARQGRCERTELGPLAAADADALASHAAALRPLPRALRERLLGQTAGNPLFLLETLRLLLARPAAPDAPQDCADLPLAPTVRGVIAARLDRRGARERETLALAAVLGERFEAGVLVACRAGAPSPGGAEATWRDLERLERDGLLRPLGDGYRFAHPLFREVAYASIGAARRRALHRRAAAALRAAGAPPETLAEHHRQAGEHDAAFALAVRAAEAAAGIHAVAGAIRLYKMGLAAADLLPAASAPAPGERAALHRRLGDLQLLDGDSGAALAASEPAPLLLAAAATGGDAGAARELALVHCAAAEAHLRRGEDEQALRSAELAEGAPALAGTQAPPGLAARLGLLRARSREAHARYDEAAALAGAVLTDDRSPAGAEQRAEAAWLLGLLGWERGEWDAAERWCGEGLAAAVREGQPRWAAAFRTGLARVAMARGAYPEATRLLHEAEATYGELGDQRGLGLCANHLGNVALYQGDYATARDRHRRSLAIKERDDNLRGAAAAHHNLGLIECRTGDLPAARDHLARCLALEGLLANPRGLAETLLALATVERHAGDLDAARRHLDAAAEQFAAVPDPVLHAMRHLALAALDLERGSWQAAQERCAAALAAAPPAPAGVGPAPLAANQIAELALLEGRALLLAGRPAEALRRLEGARTGPAADQPEAALLAAEALRALGELERAAAVADGALAAARERGLAREEGLALRVLGQIAGDRWAYPDARELLLRSVAALDGMGAALEATRSRAALAALTGAAGCRAPEQ